MYLVNVVLPAVVVIFLASRLSNSNFVVEVDRGEIDEHSSDRRRVDELIVVDVNVGLNDAQTLIILTMMPAGLLCTPLPC